MNKMKKFSPVWLLTRRNLKIFLSEKMAVFGSALAPLIVLLLFILFLKNTQIKALEGTLLEFFPDFKYEKIDLNNFVNTWLISGVLCTAMITVPLGASTCLCNDNIKKMNLMFSSSPVKSHKIVISYFAMIYSVSLMIVYFVFLIGLSYVCGISKTWIGWTNFFVITSVILLFLVGSTFITVFIISFVKTNALFQVINIIIGTTCGFIVGAYIPTSQFPNVIESFCNVFPASSATALIKNFLMDEFLKKFSGGNILVCDELKKFYGCGLYFGDKPIDKAYQWVYIGLFPVVMILLNTWRFGFINRVKN